MNKLLNPNGGIAFENDDLQWMQNATIEAWYGFLSAFGISPTASFIISGCAIDTGTGTYAAGYISLAGEILKVDAGTLPTAAPDLFWDLDVTNDPAGNEVLYSGGSADTYEVRKGIIKAGSATGKMPITAFSLIEKITGKTARVDCTKSTPSGTVIFGTGNNDMIYRFWNKHAHVGFNITAEVTAGNPNYFTVQFPAGLSRTSLLYDFGGSVYCHVIDESNTIYPSVVLLGNSSFRIVKQDGSAWANGHTYQCSAQFEFEYE